jgi:hypothetical protein
MLKFAIQKSLGNGDATYNRAAYIIPAINPITNHRYTSRFTVFIFIVLLYGSLNSCDMKSAADLLTSLYFISIPNFICPFGFFIFA